MKLGLLMVGAAAAGISALYLLDEKRGHKRRKMLKKNADRIYREASARLKHYSQDLKPYWEKYSKELAHEAQKAVARSNQRMEEKMHNGWAPSARMLGATAGAMAFYGAGRKGVLGAALRLASLGLLTRALLASR